MKHFWLLCLCACSALFVKAQLDSTGASHVGFTVDADTRTGYAKFGSITANIFNDDDWFAPNYTGNGSNVIDTSNAAFLRTQLQAGVNLNFTRRMALPPYAINKSRFWVDGIYFRDYAKSDKSSFITANKNGDNPNSWVGGISQVGAKTDIVDAYTHVRTSGLSPTTDSVWFFAGVSTLGTSGARYYDIEIYKEPISYDTITNRFSSAGPSFGHSAWSFDASGNVTQTGDIIISVTYNNTGAPVIDFRIWVSQTTYNTVVPQAFKFTNQFFSAGSSGFGYAEIVSNSSSNRWGSGMGNFSATGALTDSTYSTPWGTVNTAGNWSQNYDRLQFVEVALNFSRFGMNPFSYVTSFCRSPYSSIIIKSRSSPSFDANLVDFVIPQSFTVKNVADFSVIPDTLSCRKTSGMINLNVTARNQYRWRSLDGTLLRADSDATTFPVTAPGTYVIESTNFQGCPALRRDTVVIPADTSKPVASINYGYTGTQHQLVGGNESWSNYSTPFGGSGGLLWNWTGPDNFTSTNQTILVDQFVDSAYRLTVTERRNGCTATAIANMFTLLNNNKITLSAHRVQNNNVLSWNNISLTGGTFQVQKSTDGRTFYTISTVSPSGRVLTHHDAATGNAYYRIQYSGAQKTYSNTVWVQAKNTNVVIAKTNNTVYVRMQGNTAARATVTVADMSGRIIAQQDLATDEARINLPLFYASQPVVVTVGSKDGVWAFKKVR